MGRFSLVLIVMGIAAGASRVNADVKLIGDGAAGTVICAPADLMADNAAPVRRSAKPVSTADRERETQRVRLRESVKDLALYLGKMSGMQVEIITAPPPQADKRIPILIGNLARQRFGDVGHSFPYKQAFRVVVSPQAIGCYGESDLACSYAIYEILHRLGCRWYMPGELGEIIPQSPTIQLPEMDFKGAPATIYRGIWYADEAYLRRNRCGGLRLSAGHALEMYISAEERQQHPEWMALIGGKPSPKRLRWSNPELANAIADKIIAKLDKDYHPSVSLSPDDGDRFDESPEDRALDAGDFDPTMNGPSITDRLIVLCNRIAGRVTAKYPDVLFGMLAYVQYTRPPVREKLHPNIVPQIAPITYSRAHPMTDDAVPGNKDLRRLIEGWGSACGKNGTSMYFYGWFLAEGSGPNPMITKWGQDIPIIYRNNCRFWQPETLPNFETSMHGLYMGLRMAWDSSQNPQDIVDELNQRFYGHAASKMAEYWKHIDSAWTGTSEYSGCGFGHLRRWTPATLQTARRLIDEALASCQTIAEHRRVTIADQSLRGFELFMKMRRDLADGRFETLPADSIHYRGQMMDLADQYKDASAFAKPFWARQETVNTLYFKDFYDATYQDAARIANRRQFAWASPAPLRQWHYEIDPKKTGEADGWQQPAFIDKDWKTTDPCVETWSSLGLHDYFGAMWYRATISLPRNSKIATGKKVYLWLSAADGAVKVFVNGRAVPSIDAQGKPQDEFTSFARPASFDITEYFTPAGSNQITLRCTRLGMNEVGTGGLLGPAVIYWEK